MIEESIEIIELGRSVGDILHFNKITSVIIAIVLGICVLVGILIRGLFIYYIQYKAANDRPINKMIFCDQLVQISIGSIYPFMLIFSMASQTELYLYFGNTGCFIFWISATFSSDAFVAGGFGMALFRLMCILNQTGPFRKATLAKLIIFASFFLVCCMIALALAGISIVGWDHVPMYLLCKDFGTMKAEVLQDYNGMSDQGFGKFLRTLPIYVAQLLFIFETLIYVKIYFKIWNHNKDMIFNQVLSTDVIQQRNRKNVITLSGQVISFAVEFFTSLLILAGIFIDDLADPSHQPILLIFASTIISCVQLGTSHEMKRFVKSLIEE